MRWGNSSPKAGNKAGTGKHVVIDLITMSGSERLEFDIVPDKFADFDRGYLGAGTPLAKTIHGLSAGQSVPYTVGDGKFVRVLSVDPAKNPLPTDTISRREETYRKAVEQSDRTNAMIFASSFSGKWGDYDPTGFVEEEEDEQDQEV